MPRNWEGVGGCDRVGDEGVGAAFKDSVTTLTRTSVRVFVWLLCFGGVALCVEGRG